MRKKIVAGNWKMNLSFDNADELLYQIGEQMEKNIDESVDIVVCPPSLFLELATDFAQDVEIKVGAQNVSQFDNGAYTGEISAEMMKSMDLDYCIVGHSERRKYFNEKDEVLAKKIDNLLKNHISPILCVGEQLEERESNKHLEVIANQLINASFHLSANEFSNLVIAYEPVWAIGTGKTATPEQAQEIHAYIRSIIAKHYNKEIADNISILYGGSCNATNAKELFQKEDIDGGLIGGASLKAIDFIKIVNSF